MKAERKDGWVVVPGYGSEKVAKGEAFAIRLQEPTGCLIADRRNGRLTDASELGQEMMAAG